MNFALCSSELEFPIYFNDVYIMSMSRFIWMEWMLMLMVMNHELEKFITYVCAFVRERDFPEKNIYLAFTNWWIFLVMQNYPLQNGYWLLFSLYLYHFLNICSFRSFVGCFASFQNCQLFFCWKWNRNLNKAKQTEIYNSNT